MENIGKIKGLENHLVSFAGLNSHLLTHHRDTYPQIKLSVGHRTTLFTGGILRIMPIVKLQALSTHKLSLLNKGD